MSTIAGAMWELERLGIVIEDYKIGPSFDENGREYLTICAGGQKEEGAPMPAAFASPEAAIDDWARQVRKAARREMKASGLDPDKYHKFVRLIFRIRPELDSFQIGDDPSPEFPYARKISYFHVYSRLSFSFGPSQEEKTRAALISRPIPKTEEAAAA